MVCLIKLMTGLTMAVLPACREVLVVHIVHFFDPDVLYIRRSCGDCHRAQPASVFCGLHHLLCAVESLQRCPHHPAASAGAPLLRSLVEVQVGRWRVASTFSTRSAAWHMASLDTVYRCLAQSAGCSSERLTSTEIIRL